MQANLKSHKPQGSCSIIAPKRSLNTKAAMAMMKFEGKESDAICNGIDVEIATKAVWKANLWPGNKDGHVLRTSLVMNDVKNDAKSPMLKNKINTQSTPIVNVEMEGTLQEWSMTDTQSAPDRSLREQEKDGVCLKVKTKAAMCSESVAVTLTKRYESKVDIDLPVVQIKRRRLDPF